MYYLHLKADSLRRGRAGSGASRSEAGAAVTAWGGVCTAPGRAGPGLSRSRAFQATERPLTAWPSCVGLSPPPRRIATVQAHTKLTCLVLGRDDFTRMLGPLQKLMEREKSPQVQAWSRWVGPGRVAAGGVRLGRGGQVGLGAK
jgi:hypothetical protein